MSERPIWMDDPTVSQIPPVKLEFLKELAENGHGKSQREMMPYIMTLMKRAKAQGLTFSAAEIQTIIAAIRRHSSPEELHQMDEIMKKVSPK